MGGMATRRVVAWLTALAAAAATAGCDEELRTEGSLDTQALPLTDINPVPREEIPEGGVLHWGINEFPAQWNPHHTAGNLAVAHTVLNGLLPRPFLVEEGEAVRPNPDYVLDYTVETEPEQEVRLSLHPEATWSTGEPITWRDYAAMAASLSGSEPDHQIISPIGYDRIAEVREGGDEYEVVITFDRPFVDFAKLFSPLLPAEYTEDPERFNEGFRGDLPVTAGPFALDSIDRTARTITLERDEEWWGEPAKLDGIVFRALDPTAFEGAFLEGAIDVYQLPLDAGSYERIAGADTGEIRSAYGVEYRHLTLNGESPILGDVSVRHAVFLALDRSALAEAALGGVGVSPMVLNHRLLLPHRDGYQDNSGEWGEFDPGRAAELLDAAGWEQSEEEGVRHRDGEPFSLRLIVPRGHAPAQTEAELILAMLSDVGIDVVIEAVAGDSLFSDYVLPGNYDLVAFNYDHGAFPVSESFHQWTGTVPASNGGETWRANVARISDPEIDEALEQALDAGKSEEERLAHINEADRLLWESGHTLPLYQRPTLFATREDLANLGPSGAASLDFADIGFEEG